MRPRRAQLILARAQARSDGAAAGEIGELQLRTLAEMGLDKVLPNKGAKQVYKRALEWTDSDEGPGQYDPFVSLSRRGRQGADAEETEDAEAGSQGQKFHKMVTDQLKNVISAPYAVGHIGRDMGLQYSTYEYVWGVTYERRDVPKISQKARVLLVRRDVLEQIGQVDAAKVVPDSGNPGYDRYRRDRLKKLQMLREL